MSFPERGDIAGSTPIPAPFRDWLNGNLGDVAVELITAGEDGWPHLTHLSRGELVADAGGDLRLALWKTSRGVANLVAGARGCLILTVPEAVLELRLECVWQGPLEGHEALHAFRLRPVEARDKSAPYAVIESPLRFRLTYPETTHARWALVRRSLVENDMG